MRRRLATHLILVLTGMFLVAGAPHAPSFPDDLAGDPALRGYLLDLLRLSGNGTRSTERGAFIVRDDDGGIRCVLWPFHNGFQREEYEGAIPRGTIAVAHTHPRGHPFPSFGDTMEASRLKLSFVVVTPRNLYAVDAGGRTHRIVRNEWWTHEVEPTAQACEEPRR